MLKLKDFPPEADFRAVMARHHDDFLGMLKRWAGAAAAAAWMRVRTLVLVACWPAGRMLWHSAPPGSPCCQPA